MAIAYLALGSNIDDRLAFLAKAESMLNASASLRILESSRVYETEPWPKENHTHEHPQGEEGMGWFLNQVIKVETEFSPQELAKLISEIEAEVGEKAKKHWGSREIDIDVLLYEDQVIDSPNLEIPHRHMRDRQFILVPLVELAPNLVDPVTGTSFKQILETVKKVDSHKVTPFL